MSRRSGRRERRELKRQKQPESIEDVISLENLYKIVWIASRQVKWKQSVQRYLINILFKIHAQRQAVLKGKDVRQGTINFKIYERGKKREIQSLHFAERIIQESLCRNVLQPRFYKTLIKENSASQKGKGTSFAAKVLEKQLREFLRKYGSGYILTIDFKRYFENIRHEPLFEFYEKNLTDARVIKLCKDFVSAYSKGLGLGSVVSQFNAIIYINKIDRFIKHKFKYYGRYMDDSYIIAENKEELKEFFEVLKVKYNDLGIVINEKKTKIIPLNQGFTFLKTRYKIAENNKIIKKPCRSSITRARRRFSRMIKLIKSGKMTIEDFKRAYYSWQGSMLRRHARKSIYNLKRRLQNDLLL